jgi:hypothetical protein
MGKERAYSAKPSITSGDQCRVSLPGLALLLGMGAGEAGGGRRVLYYSYKHTSTGGGSAAPRVAKPDGVVDGIFP